MLPFSIKSDILNEYLKICENKFSYLVFIQFISFLLKNLLFCFSFCRHRNEWKMAHFYVYTYREINCKEKFYIKPLCRFNFLLLRFRIWICSMEKTRWFRNCNDNWCHFHHFSVLNKCRFQWIEDIRKSMNG